MGLDQPLHRHLLGLGLRGHPGFGEQGMPRAGGGRDLHVPLPLLEPVIRDSDVQGTAGRGLVGGVPVVLLPPDVSLVVHRQCHEQTPLEIVGLYGSI